MSTHWVLEPSLVSHLSLPLPQVSALLSRLGQSGQHAVAEDLLRLVGAQVPLAQCTIFAYEGQGRPRIVAVGDRSRTLSLPDISEMYVSRFYRLDGIALVMRTELAAARKASAEAPRIVLHRQRAEHLSHPEYRRICYDEPRIAERLAVMALFQGRRWFSVNLYRGTEHGPFDPASIAVVEAFAPLIVHAVRLHHTGEALHQELPDWLLAKLLQRFPGLTRRDCDVVQCLMDGLGTDALAQKLGLTLSSAQTYQKRLFRKLGVGGQRELLGLLMRTEPGG
jgi:DNA-binding CsgD family transcriptional regulator